jgi:translocation protein SEC62
MYSFHSDVCHKQRLTPSQTPEDIKQKKLAKKEKKAAKLAAKSAGANGKPQKSKKALAAPEDTESPAPAPVESAPQPTGSEPATESGTVTQRPPPARHATVEEVEEE